jgi:hypothetical protein
MTFIRKNILVIAGIVVGAVGGYLYYYYVGCVSGSCAITSKPLNSTLYGAVMGFLLFSSFKKEKNKTINNQ